MMDKQDQTSWMKDQSDFKSELNSISRSMDEAKRELRKEAKKWQNITKLLKKVK